MAHAELAIEQMLLKRDRRTSATAGKSAAGSPAVLFALFALVLVGGATRLTTSVSITEWNPSTASYRRSPRRNGRRNSASTAHSAI